MNHRNDLGFSYCFRLHTTDWNLVFVFSMEQLQSLLLHCFVTMLNNSPSVYSHYRKVHAYGRNVVIELQFNFIMMNFGSYEWHVCIVTNTHSHLEDENGIETMWTMKRNTKLK